MPTIKLQGGLGNQMFQYALAYSISQKNNEEIFYDGRSVLENRFKWANWTFRDYELNVFGISKKYSSPSIGESQYIHPKLYEFFNRLIHGKHYIKEQGGLFIQEFPKKSYLDGWFQSYRYFEGYEQKLLELFEVQTAVNKENQYYLDLIHQNEGSAVSLHVRRGDYVSLSGANKWHGVCSIGYYEAAIDQMIQSVTSPIFFIFSDDITWCRENIILPEGVRVYYIDHNGSRGHEDMRLMYSCHHHIIANSSFSWWGAYLGKNPNKIIVAPQKWLETDTSSTQNLIPPSWILL